MITIPQDVNTESVFTVNQNTFTVTDVSLDVRYLDFYLNPFLTFQVLFCVGSRSSSPASGGLQLLLLRLWPRRVKTVSEEQTDELAHVGAPH